MIGGGPFLTAIDFVKIATKKRLLRRFIYNTYTALLY